MYMLITHKMQVKVLLILMGIISNLKKTDSMRYWKRQVVT